MGVPVLSGAHMTLFFGGGIVPDADLPELALTTLPSGRDV